MPVGARDRAEAIRIGSEYSHAMRKAVMKGSGHNTMSDDEGGLCAQKSSPLPTRRSLHHQGDREERRDSCPADDVLSRLDPAATSSTGRASSAFPARVRPSTPKAMARYLDDLAAATIVSTSRTACAEGYGWGVGGG